MTVEPDAVAETSEGDMISPSGGTGRMTAEAPAREVIYRHALLTRVTHWINVVCIVLMLMSGFQIFNAHRALYWGKKGADFDPHWFALPNGFPHWATVPSWQDLATGRAWHFAFAWIFVINGLVYLLFGLISGHFRRDFLPTLVQIRGIGGTILDHLRLRWPRGEEAKTYNVLQKFAYIGIVIVLPLMVLTGLTMSPGFDTTAPWLLVVFGGRQSARSLHFLFAWSIIAFVIVHLLAIVFAGPINEIRSMITGRYVVKPEEEKP